MDLLRSASQFLILEHGSLARWKFAGSGHGWQKGEAAVALGTAQVGQIGMPPIQYGRDAFEEFDVVWPFDDDQQGCMGVG